ncbi:universal stress protein [Sphingobacterium faecium]|uniref:universal stress protein n=1 Tax=Sphingobacterium faecium TaxID=34087 RepID=UPI00320869F1
METIVFLTDFSVTARHAFNQLLTIAKRTEIKNVIIYHSLAYYNSSFYGRGDFMLPPPLIDDVEIDEVKGQLRHLKRELLNVSPLTDVSAHYDLLAVMDGVLRISENDKIDLIVVGLRGSGDGGKNSVGSTTIDLIESHSFNLLLVPEMNPTHQYKNALLAVDLSHLHERLPVKTIFQMQELLSLEWHVVNVSVLGQQSAAQLIEEQSFLHSSLDSLEPIYSYLEGEDIVSKINTYVEDHHIDLLVTAPRKLGFLATLFRKSASKKLAVHTRVPILMLVP